MTSNYPQGDPNQPYQPPAQGYQPPAQGYQPAGQPYQPAGAPMNPYSSQQPPAPYPGAAPQGSPRLADWGTRALGGLVDYVAPSIIFSLLGTPFAPRADYASGTVVGGGIVYYLITAVLSLLWVLYNSGIKQGTTGQTFGKQLAKTKMVSEATGQPIGIAMAIVRQIAHILDGICFIGYLFPLWDAKKQTFADKIMKTVVVKI